MLTDRLTFADADDVIVLGQQQRQSLHQQQSFVVAQRRGLAVVEHLIQRRHLHLSTRPLSQKEPSGGLPAGSLPTICTAWLKSSRSAVMEETWSIRRCFLEKKRSRRVLSERQDATLHLYSSFSLRTTAQHSGALASQPRG